MKDEEDKKCPDRLSTEEELFEYQQRAERLAFENKMLRAVLDSMPDNISIKDLKGRYIFDNCRHARFLGATNSSEVVGKTVFDFLPTQIAAKFHAEDLRVLRSGEPVVQSVDEAVDRAGNKVWMSVTKMSLRDEKGELIGLVSTTRDITARKNAEEQLAKYAEELREKNAELEEDLETARELQNALLPQQYPLFPSSALPAASALGFHHFFRPSSGLGGDFFYVFQLSDTVAGFRILNHTRLPMFVSACYLLADIARGELRYANAGHPAPLCVHRAQRSVEPLSFRGSKLGPVLGIFDDAEYHCSSCKLSAGDTLLLFTDGLFEVEGADAQYYDQARLLRSVSQRAGLCAGELCQQLVAEVQQFAVTKDFADDVCLIAVEIDHLMKN